MASNIGGLHATVSANVSGSETKERDSNKQSTTLSDFDWDSETKPK